MSVLTELAEFVLTADAGKLPVVEQDILWRHVTDVMLAGRLGGGCETSAFSDLEDQDLGGWHTRMASRAATVRCTEMDDIHIATCVTPSSVTVPVAMGLANARLGKGADGKGAGEYPVDPGQLASAIWVGTELMVRLGRAIDGASVLYQGIWPTRVAAPLGAAAAACRMVADSGRKGKGKGQDTNTVLTARALSFALMMTAPRMGRISGPMSGRWILFMDAIRSGLLARDAAWQGFGADLALLDGAWLEQMLGVPVDIARLTAELGNGSIYPEMSLKPYCTSRQALAATEAMRQLLADGLDPTTITDVRVRVPSAYAGMISTPFEPAVASTSYVNAGAMMAIAAFHSEHLNETGRERIIDDPRIRDLSQKVTVTADPDLDPLFPQKWPAVIEVGTTSGTRACSMIDVIGDPEMRFSDSDMEQKVRRALGVAGLGDQADNFMRLCTDARYDAGACAGLVKAFSSGEWAFS